MKLLLLQVFFFFLFFAFLLFTASSSHQQQQQESTINKGNNNIIPIKTEEDYFNNLTKYRSTHHLILLITFTQQQELQHQCIHCKLYRELFSKYSLDYKNQIKFFLIEYNQNLQPLIISELKITHLPSVIIFNKFNDKKIDCQLREKQVWECIQESLQNDENLDFEKISDLNEIKKILSKFTNSEEFSQNQENNFLNIFNFLFLNLFNLFNTGISKIIFIIVTIIGFILGIITLQKEFIFSKYTIFMICIFIYICCIAGTVYNLIQSPPPFQISGGNSQNGGNSITFFYPSMRMSFAFEGYIAAFCMVFSQQQTVLDRYVWNNTNSPYSYTLLSKQSSLLGTVYVLNMTSQNWLTPMEVGKRSLWFHYLQITVPLTLNKEYKDTFLMLDQTDNNVDYKSLTQGNEQSFFAATASGSVYTTLYSIPNQPIVFKDDLQQRGLYEDQLIAYTWKHYFLNEKELKTKRTTSGSDAKGSDKAAEWVLHLPMTKAVIKAMDTLQDFLRKEVSLNIEKFIIGGHSKRGWIAWLAASVDPHRVKGIIPLVIPVLNSPLAFGRIYDNICKWPEAFWPYISEGVTNYFNTSQFVALSGFIDPFIYRDRYVNIDKYLVYAMGDELFSPDLSTFSFNYLDNGSNDHKFIRYVPNVGHGLDFDSFIGAFNFYIAVLNNHEIPKYKFTQTFENNGARLRVTILNNRQPNVVRLWQATNSNARDFRIGVIGQQAFKSTDLSPISPFTYEVFVPNPSTGYTAFTIELEFPTGYLTGPLKFSTSAYITPNTVPCHLGTTSNSLSDSKLRNY
ncbi:hypothetical protein ABK040_002471 [Willaertia magna]